MTADQCHERANLCAINASLSGDSLVSQEFLRMAAQWRAMANRAIFLGSIDKLFGLAPETVAPPGIGR